MNKPVEQFPMTVAARKRQMENIVSSFVVVQCGSCNADIWWLKNTVGKKKHPVNVEPDLEKGTIGLQSEHPGEFRFITGEALASIRRMGVGEMYRSHFDTCPDADKYRKNLKK